jgi:ABC-type transport system involved in multi-copper enzyme maturation permease subunit
MEFLNLMLFILGIIGISLLILSIFFAVFVKVEELSDLLFKFNILVFLTGLSYLFFILIVIKLVKGKLK